MTRDLYRRYRMELRLEACPRVPALPPAVSFAAWTAESPVLHAELLHRAFLDETDGQLFTAFGSRESCLELLGVLSAHARFLPEASPVILHNRKPVACVQTLTLGPGGAAVQTLAVHPGYRRRGLATAMMAYVLAHLHREGRNMVRLEVTGCNRPALELYQRLGFQRKRTSYREAPAVSPAEYAI